MTDDNLLALWRETFESWPVCVLCGEVHDELPADPPEWVVDALKDEGVIVGGDR